MPGDLIVSDSAKAPAPKDTAVPPSTRYIVKQVQALYDGSAAGGDYLPALEIVSDAGIVTGRYVGTVVTAGTDQEVTFHPLGSKGGASATVAVSAPLVFARCTSQVIPSGAATAIVFNTYGQAQGSQPAIDLSTFPATFSNPTVLAVAPFIVTLTVTWPAANFDRYTEIEPQWDWITAAHRFTTRKRDSLSPDGDLQSLTMLVDLITQGASLHIQVFQASGVNRTISADLSIRGVTSLIPPTFS